MRIVICGSIAHIEKMIECKGQLEILSHSVVIPSFQPLGMDGGFIDQKEFYRLRKSGAMNLAWFEREKSRAIREHFEKIAQGDGVLIVNEEKNGVAGYIGGNTLMEMGLAFYLKKKIYLLYPIPELGYKEEIIGMKPEILNGDVSRIFS